eukprot:scaffold7956_cov124-Isochrysis_galbana.AAC.2
MSHLQLEGWPNSRGRAAQGCRLPVTQRAGACARGEPRHCWFRSSVHQRIVLAHEAAVLARPWPLGRRDGDCGTAPGGSELQPDQACCLGEGRLV